MVINKSAVIKFVIDPVIVIVVITCVPILVTVHISLVRVGHELAVVQVVLPSVIVVVPVRVFVGLCRVVHAWTVVARVSDPVTVAVQLLRVGYFHTIVKRICYSVAINVIIAGVSK